MANAPVKVEKVDFSDAIDDDDVKKAIASLRSTTRRRGHRRTNSILRRDDAVSAVNRRAEDSYRLKEKMQELKAKGFSTRNTDKRRTGSFMDNVKSMFQRNKNKSKNEASSLEDHQQANQHYKIEPFKVSVRTTSHEINNQTDSVATTEDDLSMTQESMTQGEEASIVVNKSRALPKTFLLSPFLPSLLGGCGDGGCCVEDTNVLEYEYGDNDDDDNDMDTTVLESLHSSLDDDTLTSGLAYSVQSQESRQQPSRDMLDFFNPLGTFLDRNHSFATMETDVSAFADPQRGQPTAYGSKLSY